MQIKSIVAGAAIALIAGVGSVSAADDQITAISGDTGAPFAMLDGIATEQMSEQEMASILGAYAGDPTTIPTLGTVEGPLVAIHFRIYELPPVNFGQK